MGGSKAGSRQGARWQAACMAGSGRTGAAQHGACKGMEEQSRQGTGRGAGGAGQEEKEKGGAGDQEGLGCLYRGG